MGYLKEEFFYPVKPNKLKIETPTFCIMSH